MKPLPFEIRYVTMTPLENCLSIWQRWHDREDENIGWNRRSPMLSSEGSLDPHQLYDNADMQVAEAVEAMVNSLTAQHEAAIRHRCGHSRVWRFQQLDFTLVLPEAEAELEKKLRANVFTSFLF
ncbi:hypothetical protein [Massilia sp. TS11]|uniref:hypothetical protein n=1 Tax=Massilia sp. TS11 TaxID=2908003 RepID=UPI001EDC6F0B|nr:hypothetical protein [Massilia sp. TS11]MCG2586511.1 hypothetical protein [Massilia sp. TS11]